MGLNKSTGNMYEFITHTWNTIKGECPHACSYCYMHRWGKQPPLHFDENELKTKLGHGNYIFVGSSCDMFAKDIPEEWIIKTLEHCNKYSENRYFFQSKNPEKMIHMLKNISFNYDICTTIETNRNYQKIMNNSPSTWNRATEMMKYDNSLVKKYVTIEPIMDFDMYEMIQVIRICNPVQVNIGADSGHNNLPEPPKEKILQLIEELQKFTVIANKKNLERLIK